MTKPAEEILDECQCLLASVPRYLRNRLAFALSRAELRELLEQDEAGLYRGAQRDSFYLDGCPIHIEERNSG